MVKVKEYKDDQFMINVTKEEALRIISSLSRQILNNDCNKDRVEFGKSREDDVTYFSVAVDQIMTEFHVFDNISFDKYTTRDIFFARKKTLKEAQDFIEKIEEKDTMNEHKLWIKEVQL